MMKVKYLIMLLVTVAFMLLIPNISSAAVEYTRTIPSNEGTIKINFTGLELDPMKAYEFALVRQGGTPENWFSIDDGYTTSEATVTLNSATSKIVEVLKTTDTGFIYIREKDNATGTYVLQAQQVNLKLPYLQSLSYSKNNIYYDIANMIYGSIGNEYTNIGADYTYAKWEKVTNEDLVEKFLSIKNNNNNITELEGDLPNPPTTGYTTDRSPNYTDKNDGLYLLWVKRTGGNCKDIYSCIVHDGLPEATKLEQYIKGLDVEKPTVNSIAVTSPVSGTYKTGQTVKITVRFSEVITGETVPTLKIKFGTSEERTVTNGTITENKIVYSYNILDGDKGQLAVTGYSGGTIKDAAGNDAVITSKTVSGYTIKANVEGTTTNNTQNQDQTNNEENKNEETNKDDGKDKVTITKKSYKDHTYLIVEEKMTWEEAKAYCEKQGGHLLTINSAEEQAFITSYIKEVKLTQNRFWIGATDAEKEGTWKWITNEKFGYSNWGNGQPDNSETGGQNYGVYVAYDTTYNGKKLSAGQWDDINNGAEQDIYFICEWGVEQEETKKPSTETQNNNTTTQEKDNTVAQKEYDKAGAGIGIIAGMVIVISAGAVALSKYRKLSDI